MNKKDFHIAPICSGLGSIKQEFPYHIVASIRIDLNSRCKSKCIVRCLLCGSSNNLDATDKCFGWYNVIKELKGE